MGLLVRIMKRRFVLEAQQDHLVGLVVCHMHAATAELESSEDLFCYVSPVYTFLGLLT